MGVAEKGDLRMDRCTTFTLWNKKSEEKIKHACCCCCCGGGGGGGGCLDYVVGIKSYPLLFGIIVIHDGGDHFESVGFSHHFSCFIDGLGGFLLGITHQGSHRAIRRPGGRVFHAHHHCCGPPGGEYQRHAYRCRERGWNKGDLEDDAS